LLFDICGFDTDYAPAVAPYYDLIVRLWIADSRTKAALDYPHPDIAFFDGQKLNYLLLSLQLFLFKPLSISGITNHRV